MAGMVSEHRLSPSSVGRSSKHVEAFATALEVIHGEENTGRRVADAFAASLREINNPLQLAAPPESS